MISYDFEYYKPSSIVEATQLYQSLYTQEKQPIYFSGLTELVTLGRVNRIITGAVIDMKGIPDLHVLKLEQNQLLMGAALSLAKLQEMNLFPLLTKTISEIADHTARTKITLGGNICGNIYYRESVLPLLLTDSQLVIASPAGLKRVPIQQVFQQQLRIEEGEFLVQVITDQSYLSLPNFSVKRRKQGSIGYPLATVCALKTGGQVRVAFSGVCPFPFRDQRLEEALNNKQLSPETRVDQALQRLPVPVLDDVEGSAEYRLFVLRNTLLDVLTVMEGKVR